MSANFACARCSSSAVVFCMCEPSKVFLCGNCIVAHRTKPGAHVYGDLDAHASVQTAGDFGAYSEKTQAVGKVRKCLEELATMLTGERRRFEDYWSWAYEDLRRKVQVLEQMKQDTDSLYQQLEAEIGKLSEGLAQSTAYPALKELIKAPTHLAQQSLSFLAFESAVNTCYSEGIYTCRTALSLTDLVTSWHLAICECSDCKATRKGLRMDVQMLLVEICTQNPQLPLYQAEEAAVRMQLKGTLHPVYLEPLGQKKKK